MDTPCDEFFRRVGRRRPQSLSAPLEPVTGAAETPRRTWTRILSNSQNDSSRRHEQYCQYTGAGHGCSPAPRPADRELG